MTTTACNNIAIGSEGCSIFKVITCLKSSPSFSLLHDSWSYIANDLETSRILVKRLRRDCLLDKITLIDIVHELMEEWIGRTSDKATILEFARILEENGLKNCAEYLANGFKVNQNEEEGRADLIKSLKKYHRIPPRLNRFLQGNSKFCILHTLDNEITCQKISENVTSTYFHVWKGFLDLISAPVNPDRSLTEVDIIQGCTIRNLKQLIKLQHIIEGVGKLIFVTCEDENEIQAVLGKLVDFESCIDTMSWDDLTHLYQAEIIDELEETYGIELDEEVIDNQLLVDLINRKTFKLFKNTLPDELSYYVNRRLLSRHFISSKVFELNSSDIFLFTGMELYELSNQIRDKMADNSSHQIAQAHITVRYMILEQPNHFDRICAKTKEAVHLLQYKNGRLRWIRSNGRMDGIQRCVGNNNSQEESTDKEFYLNLSAEAVCISDSPGMGKSVLLTRIGRTLEGSYPDRIVLFMVIKELINHIKNSGIRDIPNAIESALKATVCKNVVAEAVLTSKLHPRSGNQILIELLLDGFDEISRSDSKLSYRIMQAIRTSFKSVRLWVTSRPHLLNELENNLNLLGFNIQPFSDDDQIQFLTSFWTTPEESYSLDTERIRLFAGNCLSSLKTKLNSKDRDIAGIPLQCLLVGEVYREDAVGYAESTNQVPIVIDSVTNLYLQLIMKKLEKYKSSHDIENLDEQLIMEMHVLLSLEIIFPEELPKLQHLLHPVNIEELLKIGILESSGPVGSHRFIHRTFAEFFVAWFVTRKLKGRPVWEDTLTDFYLDSILRTKRSNKGEFKRDLYATIKEFDYPIIAYFVDSMLAGYDYNDRVPADVMSYITRKSENAPEKQRRLAFACASSDFVNIFKFLEGLKAFDKNAHTIFDSFLVIHAANHSCLELVKICLIHFEQNHEFGLDVQLEVLHAAVRGGRFITVQYLIKEKGLIPIIKEYMGPTKLLHACVEDTMNKTEADIQQRLQIMRMLIDINPKLLEERNTAERTPLLSLFTHIQLLVELIKQGAIVLVQCLHAETVLNVNRFYTPEDFHSLLIHIPENSLRPLLQVKDRFDSTPVINVVACFDPIPETLAVFAKFGADFNSVDEVGYSVLATAVKCRRNVNTLRKLVQYGSSLDWKGKHHGDTLLHMAALHGNIEAIEYLVDECLFDVNIENEEGLNPLTRAFLFTRMEGKSNRFFQCGLILQGKGAQLHDTVNDKGQSLLHVACKKGDFEQIRLLFHLNTIDVNSKDGEGNSPFHYAVLEYKIGKDYYSITKLLLEKGADHNSLNDMGETAYQVALRNGKIDQKTLQLLKDKMDLG